MLTTGVNMQNQAQSQEGVYQPQQQVIYTIQPPNPSGRVERFNGRASIRIGSLMIGFGVLSIALGGAAIGLYGTVYDIGTGIWCGLLFFILTGSFGIAAGRSKSKCLIIAFMVLSIVMVSIACLILLVNSSIGLANDVDYLKYQCNNEYDYHFCHSKGGGRVAINALLVLTSIIQAVLGFTSSAYCCKAVCCCNNSSGINMQNQVQSRVGAYQPQQQIIYTIQPPNPSGRVERFDGKASAIMGSLMIGFGILSIALGGAAIGLNASLFFIGTGIWCGLLFFILTGSFGIAAGRSKSKCLIITFMVLSIVMVSIACLTLLVNSSIGLANDVEYLKYQCNYEYNYHFCHTKGGRVAINALLVMASIIQAVLGITSSAYCCKAVCCCNNTSEPNTQHGHIIGQGQQGVPAMTTNGQQVIIVSGQPSNAAPISQMHATNQPGVHAINVSPGYNINVQQAPAYSASVPQAQAADGPPPQYTEKEKL
ncbi:unnamed protein product [Owenia fusiformis]|uniref:Uncharacterized protein n=1 Tax=Owenia fusiformis TaxID=6347 RepID=A0A8S4NYK2_OWEFU|nr:unnamed protein product [Owenia fusiformis]